MRLFDSLRKSPANLRAVGCKEKLLGASVAGGEGHLACKVNTMSLTMPAPDPEILSKRAAIVAALRSMVPGEGVIDDVDAMRPYESDGLTAYRQMPLVVVLPQTTAQVSAILKWCGEAGVNVTPRGAGTSLSGGDFSFTNASLD